MINQQIKDQQIKDMIERLTAEQFRVKEFLNANGFDCTTAPFVIARTYRTELKKYIEVLRNNV